MGNYADNWCRRSKERDEFLHNIRKIFCLCAICLCLTGLAEAAESYKQGDTSPKIAEMQLKMRELGYIVGAPDGFFSWKFAQAVKSYQRSQGLKSDGVVDSLTYWRLMGKSFPQPVTPPNVDKARVSVKRVEAIIATAKRYIGVPYRFGGTSPKGFDCSGYIQYVFDQHGKKLPRSADVQFTTGKSVVRSQLQVGDLVFFTTYEPGPSHDGIYLGNGQFIHASSSRGIMISKLDEPYWKPRYIGARRVL